MAHTGFRECNGRAVIIRPVDNDFAEWAFGAEVWTDYLIWDKDHYDLLQAWNHRHSDIYHCHEEETIEESLRRMNQLYKEHIDAAAKSSTPKRGPRQSRPKKTSVGRPKVPPDIGMGTHENANKASKIRGENGQENA